MRLHRIILAAGLIAAPAAIAFAQTTGGTATSPSTTATGTTPTPPIAGAGTTPTPTVSAEQLRKPAGTEAANVTTVGDFFKFNVNVEHFKPTDSDRPEVTAPQGSCFRVSQELDAPDPADKTKTRKMARGRFETGWLPRFILPPYTCLDMVPPIDTSFSYDVPRNLILEDRDRDRFGWTYGVLVAPIKFYTKAREFSAAAAVGPYLGYRVHDRQGSSSVLAISIGAATANVTTDTTSGPVTSNTTGMTAAAAYLLDIKGAFNVGLIAGADFFSKSENVPTSNKLWVGLSFGYKID